MENDILLNCFPETPYFLATQYNKFVGNGKVRSFVDLTVSPIDHEQTMGGLVLTTQPDFEVGVSWNG